MPKKPKTKSKKNAAIDPAFTSHEWPASKVEMWKLDKIIPYEKNPRTHPESQIALLADLMKKFGVDQPIVVDENGVILKGHGRLDAAKLAKFKTFPVVRHSGLSDLDKRALRISDNQVALLSGWNPALLQTELVALQIGAPTLRFELTELGFSPTELSKHLGKKSDDASPQLGEMKFAVIVDCENEDDQRNKLEKFNGMGLKCRALMS